MNVTTKNIQKNVGIILVGVIISMALSAMLLSGAKSLDVFYDAGAVYEQSYYNYSEGIEYDNTDKKLKVIGEIGIQGWSLLNTKSNYLIIDVEGIEEAGIPAVFRFYRNDQNTQVTVTRLKNGENIIPIYRQDSNYVYMILEQGVSYEYKKMQCREKLSVWDTKKFLNYGIFVFLGYFIIITIIKKILEKKKIYISVGPVLEKLEKIYGKATENVRICSSFSNKKNIRILRRILFFLLLFILNFEEKNRLFIPNWNRNVLLYSGILLVIAFLSVEEKRERKFKWNVPLVSVWLLLVICMIVSNFVIEKRFQNLGIIFFLVFNFFYYVWVNMEDKTELLQDLCIAVKAEFWLDIGRCFLFFPVVSERYAGSFYNANAYAINLMVPLTVFLAELMEKKDLGIKLQDKILPAFGVGMTIYMVWRTQSRTGLLGVVLVFGIILSLCRKDNILREKRGRRETSCLLLLIVLGICMGQIGLMMIPKIAKEERMLENVAEYEIEREMENSIFVMEVRAEAAETGRSRIIEKFSQSRTLDDFTSGRITIWKDYLRQMNFLGHKFWALSGGHVYDAHNGFLGIAYGYGVLSAVVYLYWIVYYMWYALEYLRTKRRKKRYAVFPFLLMVGIMPALMIENLEEPFRFETWIVMYLVVGILFSKELEETENVELT